MIFDLTRNYVPIPYVDSRDYRTFLRQLGALVTVFKYNVDHLVDLYNADSCPDHLLPLLADLVGYDYNEDKTVASNREIIKNFPYLIRNRGSEVGIKLAVALSVNTSADSSSSAYSTSSIVISYDIDFGLITIYYPNESVIDWSLVEVVRPVGSRIKFVRSDLGMFNEGLRVNVDAKAVARNYKYNRPYVGRSRVGFDAERFDSSSIPGDRNT